MTGATIHRKRDSMAGIDRKRLRGTLRVQMGMGTNAGIFANRGDTWDATEAEERREEQERALLERHLREASLSETRFIQHLHERLDDPGPLAPVKYDKQALATQAKSGRPARKARQGAYVKVALRVNRLINLQRERDAHEKTGAVTADKRKEYGHFVLERD